MDRARAYSEPADDLVDLNPPNTTRKCFGPIPAGDLASTDRDRDFPNGGGRECDESFDGAAADGGGALGPAPAPSCVDTTLGDAEAPHSGDAGVSSDGGGAATSASVDDAADADAAGAGCGCRTVRVERESAPNAAGALAVGVAILALVGRRRRAPREERVERRCQ